MFDAMKNLGSLPGLMAKAREMQDRMKSIQEELGRKLVTADAAGGDGGSDREWKTRAAEDQD